MAAKAPRNCTTFERDNWSGGKVMPSSARWRLECPYSGRRNGYTSGIFRSNFSRINLFAIIKILNSRVVKLYKI